MKKIILIMLLMISPAIADDKVARIGIDGLPRNATNEVVRQCHCFPVCLCKQCKCKLTPESPKETKHHKREINKILREMDKKPVKPTPTKKTLVPLSKRVWVEDVATPGLWYWGWYDYSDRKFHCLRREYKSALSNIISVVPKYRHYQTKETWSVVYER